MTRDDEIGGCVLVVDDEVAICRVVSRTLERNGFEAESVSSPHELSGVLTTKKFDVVLLDRSLGVVDGADLLPLVKEHAPHAKVLFFTGDLVDSSELSGVDGVVQKPINGKTLATKIREVLKA